MNQNELKERIFNQIYRAKTLIYQRDTFRLIQAIKQAKLTYLSFAALFELGEQVQTVENRFQGKDFCFIEAGTALGGSALLMASLKNRATPLHLYDTYKMIPAPTADDGLDGQQRYKTIASGQAEGINQDQYYGYQEDLISRIITNFNHYGLNPTENQIYFHEGVFEDTLHPTRPVALAHIDCDWYESVKTCLERIVPHLLIGGVLVIDDYFAWSGCRKAIDEFFANQMDAYRFTTKTRLHIQRVK